ncbi:hypothetical protein HNQ94_000438 [Salirhabdus euzebyi]|uniref:Uncharacterized protein n=1 Tax=Salirhabdus euzebyi TaxID=394506 RepID=A0A841PSR8_9BACI|nr:hypothetical protein [Salirhabdus euzebyi]MBB6452017.1 hypothetical protein [Salirhabdus euzebyi]
MDKKKEFDEVEVMSKGEAISEIREFFKGNKKFLDQATLFILSSHHFQKISSMVIHKDNWNWEKFLQICIDTDLGFKHFYYRKGNKKYAPSENRNGNNTHDIHEYGITVYYLKGGSIEEYKL